MLALGQVLSLLAVSMASTARVGTRALNKKSTAFDVVQACGGPGCARGKTAVVTGGASGIGLETAKALALAGCRVVVASRDPEGYKAQIEREIMSAGDYRVPDADLGAVRLDLADMASVTAAAQELVKEDRLDLLVFNAGIMAVPTLERTQDGFEKQLATNHFGHYLLWRLLEGKVRAQEEGARVVALASTAHTFGTLEPEDLHFQGRAYSPWGAYGQSKLANLLFAKSVADRTRGSKVTALSVHPGVIRTPLWRYTPATGTVGGWLLSTLVADKDVPQGAATTVYACLAPECGGEDYRGAYLADCAIAVPSEAGRDTGGARRAALWQATEAQLLEKGYAMAVKG